MKWAILAVLAVLACGGTECVLESREVRDTDINRNVENWLEAGWNCELLYARPDPIFGIAMVRTWSCSRCAE